MDKGEKKILSPDKLNEFLKADKTHIEEKYGFKFKRRVWFLLKPTTVRSGSFFPLGGFRDLGTTANKFVAPGENKLDKKPFDELLNFKNSQIGEIASKPRCKSNGPGVLYWAYGFFSYFPILQPCHICLKINNRQCHCDAHMISLISEFERVIRAKSENFFEPFTYNLERTFNLKVSTYYGNDILPGPDKLTEFHLEGAFVLSENIEVKNDKILPAKPQIRGVLEALKSVFSYKNAPEESFTLPVDFEADKDKTHNDQTLNDLTIHNSTLDDSIPSSNPLTPGKSLLDEINTASPSHPAGKPFAPDETNLTSEDVTVIQVTDQSDLDDKTISTTILPSPTIPHLIESDPLPEDQSADRSTDLPSVHPATLPAVEDSEVTPKMSTMTVTSDETPKTKEEGENVRLYPAYYMAFCYFCMEERCFKKGKCTKETCNMPFSMVPSLRTNEMLDVERYSPPFPAHMIRNNNSEREKYTCESLFNPAELTLVNGLYVIGEMGKGNPLLSNVQKILNKRGTPGNLNSFDLRALNSGVTETRERAKFLLHAIQHNFNRERRKELDPYFNLDTKMLNMICNKGFTEIGPVLPDQMPRGLVVSELRNLVERELTLGREVLTRIFNTECYKTNLGFKYQPSDDRFYRFEAEGWEMINETNLWDQVEVPFFRAFDCSPRRFYLTSILNHFKNLTNTELDDMGLEPNNILLMRGEIQEAREKDDEKSSLRKLHPLNRVLLPIDSKFDTYEEYFISVYNKCYKQNLEIKKDDPTPAPDKKSIPESKAYEGYIDQEDVDDLFNFSYSFGSMTDKARKAILKKGRQGDRDLPLAVEPPADAPYTMTELEKRNYSAIVGYNQSRGIDLDSIKEGRKNRDLYKEPKTMYNKILNDQNFADRKQTDPKTSTPIKRVSIGGKYPGDDDDDDDDDIDDRPSRKQEIDNDLNDTVNPFSFPKRHTSKAERRSPTRESIGDRLARLSTSSIEPDLATRRSTAYGNDREAEDNQKRNRNDRSNEGRGRNGGGGDYDGGGDHGGGGDDRGETTITTMIEGETTTIADRGSASTHTPMTTLITLHPHLALTIMN